MRIRDWVFILALCAVLAGGCALTRELPDGSVVTVTVDAAQVEALLDRVEQYQTDRDAARARGDAEEAARLDARIAAAIEALRTLGGER